MITITDKISIDDSEIRIEYVRASGPGGQNVNKVSTAAQLYFDILHSPALPDDVRVRLIQQAGRRVNSQGVLVIDARRFRTQEQNREDAVSRLVELVRRAAVHPRRRVKTRPTAASRERRLEAKRRQSRVKSGRRAPPPSE